VTNITMRHVTTAPIFLRLGNRARAPQGTPVGKLRRVTISNIVASEIDQRYAATVAGIPDHPVEDVLLSNIRLLYLGGGAADATIALPEHEAAYPEPSMFGTTPAYGLFVRHAKNITVRDFDVQSVNPDGRPPVGLLDVDGFYGDHLAGARKAGSPMFALENVRSVIVRGTPGVLDFARPRLAGREVVR
jgi:hypothetical protein